MLMTQIEMLIQETAGEVDFQKAGSGVAARMKCSLLVYVDRLWTK